MKERSPRRTARLIAMNRDGYPSVEAVVIRDYPAEHLHRVESAWRKARKLNEATARKQGRSPPENSHWDWRNKIERVRTGHYSLVAVQCENEVQGLMVVASTPRSAILTSGDAVYVDYLESAPWNIRTHKPSVRFGGVGALLLAEAIRMSVDAKFQGRVGLHSLPQAEAFYQRCGMTRVGRDSAYYDLTYFEYTEDNAASWLAEMEDDR